MGQNRKKLRVSTQAAVLYTNDAPFSLMYSHEKNEGGIKLNILEALDIMVAQG